MTFLSRKSKLGMNKIVAQCPNKWCTCLAIMGDENACSFVVKYLTWFRQRNKYEQDSIVFKWFRYSSFLKPSTKQKRTKNKMFFVYLKSTMALQSLMRWYASICFARVV